MLNLREIKRICILGAGTAGWFSALELRQIFNDSIEIIVVSSPDKPIVGVGEGGILNFIETLIRLNIPLLEFMEQTGAVHKLGFKYEGWRNGLKDQSDYFYHMFPISNKESLWEYQGYYPLLSGLVNHNIPISYIAESIQLQEKNFSQHELTQLFIDDRNKNFASSFHFDTYKVGKYLKKIALARGIKHIEGLVQHINQNSETGKVESILVNEQHIPLDFLIDASGFERLVVGKKFQTKWHSFSDYLIMNKAIPFHLKHRKPNPDLVTCASAMSSGWVWQIPLQERIGAGYVFNSDFISPEQAVDEVEKWLGHPIEPIRTISFEAGYFEKVWQGNVLAVGLASGFVEPLEATSIGQMLMQVFCFAKIIVETQGIVSQQTIDFFNQQNAQSWLGIRDFIRLHYDTGRSDTPFWQHVLHLPLSEKYKELKVCWKNRTPRNIDFINYEMDEFSHFGIYSWLAIAQALKIVSPEVTVAELLALTPSQRQQIAKSIAEINSRIIYK